MAVQSKARGIAGWVVSGLVGAAMLLIGSSKLLGLAPEELKENMAQIGLDNNIMLIGGLEVACGILLFIPFTSKVGALLCCSFWGGAIVAHLSLNDGGYFPAITFCILTWLAAFLRNPEMFGRLIASPVPDSVPPEK